MLVGLTWDKIPQNGFCTIVKPVVFSINPHLRLELVRKFQILFFNDFIYIFCRILQLVLGVEDFWENAWIFSLSLVDFNRKSSCQFTTKFNQSQIIQLMAKNLSRLSGLRFSISWSSIHQLLYPSFVSKNNSTYGITLIWGQCQHFLCWWFNL